MTKRIDLKQREHNKYQHDVSPTAYADRIGEKYLGSQSRIKRKSAGQYFTPVYLARRMAEALELTSKEHVSIMDPAAGVGTLLCAAVEQLVQEKSDIREISLYSYEKDERIIPLLNDVLVNLTNWALYEKGVIVHTKTFHKDFLSIYARIILSNQYDMVPETDICPNLDAVISNPPYQKLTTKTRPPSCSPKMTQGFGNVYALFMYISSCLVRDEGRLIFLTPRSYTSGPNFRSFRKNFFAIPLTFQNPKILVGYDAEVVGHLFPECLPFSWNSVSKEHQDGVGELFPGGVMTVVRHALMHDRP
nr:N-6 DNA methylase [Rhodovibrio sodomensis]